MRIIRPSQRIHRIPGYGIRDSRRAVSADASWWLLGGVDPANVVAVYQPIGAASLAASYVNLANPGTYDAAPGVAPTHAAGTGWAFNGMTQYLMTGIVPSSGYSLVVRFSGIVTDVGWLLGAYNSSGNNRFSVGNPNGVDWVEFGSGKTVTINYGAPVSSGVYAVAGQQGYRDGLASGGAIAAWNGAIVAGINIADLGGLGTVKIACNIQAVVIYSATITPDQVALISEAMAAL